MTFKLIDCPYCICSTHRDSSPAAACLSLTVMGLELQQDSFRGKQCFTSHFDNPQLHYRKKNGGRGEKCLSLFQYLLVAASSISLLIYTDQAGALILPELPCMSGFSWDSVGMLQSSFSLVRPPWHLVGSRVWVLPQGEMIAQWWLAEKGIVKSINHKVIYSLQVWLLEMEVSLQPVWKGDKQRNKWIGQIAL